MKNPSNGVGANCSTCRYFEPDACECRRKAPTRARETMPGVPYFPPTFAEGWCGQWEPDARPYRPIAPSGRAGVADLL